jgi:hypothetical protein
LFSGSEEILEVLTFMLEYDEYILMLGVVERCIRENMMGDSLDLADQYTLMVRIGDCLEFLMHESQAFMYEGETHEIFNDLDLGCSDLNDCRNACWRIPADVAVETLDKSRKFTGLYRMLMSNVDEKVLNGNIASIIFDECMSHKSDYSVCVKDWRRQLDYSCRLINLVADWRDTTIPELRGFLCYLACIAKVVASTIDDMVVCLRDGDVPITDEEISRVKRVYELACEYCREFD